MYWCSVAAITYVFVDIVIEPMIENWERAVEDLRQLANETTPSDETNGVQIEQQTKDNNEFENDKKNENNENEKKENSNHKTVSNVTIQMPIVSSSNSSNNSDSAVQSVALAGQTPQAKTTTTTKIGKHEVTPSDSHSYYSYRQRSYDSSITTTMANVPTNKIQVCVSWIKSFQAAIVYFVLFHFIGVAWTTNSLNDRSLNHILHRIGENVTSLFIILFFAMFEFECEYNICADSHTRNMYHNPITFIFIALFTFTMAINPWLFYFIYKYTLSIEHKIAEIEFTISKYQKHWQEIEEFTENYQQMRMNNINSNNLNNNNFTSNSSIILNQKMGSPTDLSA